MTALTAVGLFALLTMATARVVRAITFDDFPPAAKLRDWWDGKTIGSGWNELFHCAYCMGVWVALPAVVLAVGVTFGWGVFLTVGGVFWALCGWLAVGYLSGIIVASNWG